MDAVSNRHGFMTSKLDRKRYSFEVFTRRVPLNRFRQSRDCISKRYTGRSKISRQNKVTVFKSMRFRRLHDM